MKKYKNKPTFSLIWKISAPLLFAFMPIFGAAQNPQKEKEAKKLEQAIQDLENCKKHDICDSLYQVTNIDREAFRTYHCPEGNVEELIKRRIKAANIDIKDLRREASRPIEEKYPLSRFLTQVELNFVNSDVIERTIMCAYNCKAIDSSSIRNIDNGAYFWTGYTLMRFGLNTGDTAWELENSIHMLDYLERRLKYPSSEALKAAKTFYNQFPNENPVVTMQDGKLSFTNPKSQKLYEQYKKEMADVDKTHIFTNPEFAARYCEYSAALKEAYEDLEKLRKIGEFFDQKYKTQLNNLNRELNKLQGQEH